MVPSAPTKDTSEPPPLRNTDLRGPTLVPPDPGPAASGPPPVAPPLSALTVPSSLSLPCPLLPQRVDPNLPPPPLGGAKLSIFCRENSIFVGDEGPRLGPCLLYKLYRLWPPVCVCVCVCVCVFASAPSVPGPSPGRVPWAPCASLPTPAFPSGNVRSLLPSEPWPPVSSSFCHPLAASLHLICPQAMSRVPLTFVPYMLSAAFAQAPPGCLPPYSREEEVTRT